MTTPRLLRALRRNDTAPPPRDVAIRALSGARHNLHEIELALVGADAAERRRVAPLLRVMRQGQAGARLALRHAARPRSRWQLPRVRLARTSTRATRRQAVTVATVHAGDDPGGGDAGDDDGAGAGAGTGRDLDATAGQLSIEVERQTETTTRGGRFADA